MKRDLGISEETLNSLFRMAVENLTGEGPLWTWVKLLTPRQFLNLLIRILERVEVLKLTREEIYRLICLLATLNPEMTEAEKRFWTPEIQLWKTWPLAKREGIPVGTSSQVSTGAVEPTAVSTTLHVVQQEPTVSPSTESESIATVESNRPHKED